MAKLTTAIFPGSFDPLTLGHADIVERALVIFDRVIVAVLDNPLKSTLFDVDERVELIKAVYQPQSTRVQVDKFKGLLVDFAKSVNCTVVIRGLRAISDYDYEAQMALTNKSLNNELETFFLMTSASRSYISSSLVRQIGQFNGALDHLVPKPVEVAVRAKFGQPV